MKGDIELIREDGEVLGEGRLGEFVYVERAGQCHTVAIDTGDELVLQRMDVGQGGHVAVNEHALSMLLQ